VTHQVVAVQRDVERPDRDFHSGYCRDLAGEPAGERDAASADPDKRKLLHAAGALHDLVRDTRESAADTVAVEDYCHGGAS
jgi:hypothetical protein